MLRWLNAATGAARLSRHEHVGAAGHVEVPAIPRLRSVVTALVAGSELFRELFNGDVASVAPLVRDLDDGPIPFSGDPSDQPFELRPILKRADRYLLAEPAAAVVALRHYVIVAATEAGLVDELATRIARRSHGWVIEAVGRMGWSHHTTLPHADRDPVVSLIFGVDAARGSAACRSGRRRSRRAPGRARHGGTARGRARRQG